MIRATATAQCFSLLRLFPSLSSPHPLSPHLPRRFRFYALDSATDSSPPSSWKDLAACYAITNYCTLAHTPSICQLWHVWHKFLTSHPFSLYSDRVSGSQQFIDFKDLDDSLGPGIGNFADEADAMDAVPPQHQNLLWSLSKKGVEVAVENGWPFLFKDATYTIGRMKLFLSGSSPDVLGYEKPSMVDLMIKFCLSYASTPLFSLVLYSLFSTERYTPQGTRFCKQQRGRMKGISSSGNRICFGRYALQALEPAWITSRQIEAGRRAMTRYAGRDGKLWVRIFPDKPVTARPAETRMGKGKGSPVYWVAVVKPGRILYEVSGVTEKIAREAISIAASKMPIQTQFLISE